MGGGVGGVIEDEVAAFGTEVAGNGDADACWGVRIDCWGLHRGLALRGIRR